MQLLCFSLTVVEAYVGQDAYVANLLFFGIGLLNQVILEKVGERMINTTYEHAGYRYIWVGTEDSY